MNTYWKIIGLSLCLLLFFPEKCSAAGPEFSAGCQAQWADEKNGIAKVTLTQSDKAVTELTIGTTDYIFMIDGSRTTLNDSFLFQEARAEKEPQESHCPCMAEGHYYLISGTKILPLTYTLGYECGTGELRTWSAGRMIWSDSAGAHYNEAGKKIAVRYANNCLDIFTIFKNTAVKSIREIAQRKDGSRVAFIVYSGAADSLYGILDYTEDYETAIRKIQLAGFEPGSLLCPGIDRARMLCMNGGAPRTTKIFIMGDGRNSDISAAQKKAAELRTMPGIYIYTACMGKEACVKGNGFQAMRAMSGDRTDRFWSIQTKPQNDMTKAFSTAFNEKIPVSVGIDEKKVSAEIPGMWEYYEDVEKGYRAECNAGNFFHSGSQIMWQIPRNTERMVQCSFYVRLKEEAKNISEQREYELLEKGKISYVIRGGSRDGEEGSRDLPCNPLSWKPSGINVTKVKLLSGTSYQKQPDVWYVKGGSENTIGFSSFTAYASLAWKPEKNMLYERSENSDRPLAEYECVRSADLSHLESTYRVTLRYDGEQCEYYPSASIGEGTDRIFTERYDGTKKLTLICDAVPPDIEGVVPEIVREDRKIIFRVKDYGSGVRAGSFTLEIKNPKTGEKKVFGTSGTEISWNIRLDDPFYSGNLKWILTAEDNVGNSNVFGGTSNIRAPKGEETITNEIRTRIL